MVGSGASAPALHPPPYHPAQHKSEAELVKLRYLVSMTNKGAAVVLGIPPRTPKYYWTHSCA